ncbi:MAG TPA: ferritin [Candidatus Kapabacteria bacterium]|nr:ferritin [Candidatus Kapabacteria bacterium]
MIKQSVQDAINSQIVREVFSSNLYLSMAAYFASQSLNGFASWMRIQAQEEMTHALKFFDYLLARNANPVIGAIDAPQISWGSPLEAFEDALNHERKVTNWINELVDLAINEKDHATNAMLQWFVNEQVEEEDNTSMIVDKLNLVGNNTQGLFMLDNELGSRTATNNSL